MNEIVSKAVSTLRNSTDLEDDAIVELLVSSGVELYFAERLVTFLPMVYASHMLIGGGAALQSYYEKILSNGNVEKVELSSEPVWRESTEFYHSEISRGASSEDVLALAARSAEFDAANQALNGGNKLDEVEFGPCCIEWSVDSPQSSPSKAEKIS
jgi:hypothetical protein